MDFWCALGPPGSPLSRGISRAATNATSSPVTSPTPTSCTTNSHQTKSSRASAAAVSANTAGRASPSFSPDSRLSECRISLGTRGFVTTLEDSTGSVGERSAPTRNDSVQPRSVSAEVTTAIRPAVIGIARTRLRSGRCQAFWSISSSTSSPSRNRIRTSAITASPSAKLDSGSMSRTSRPPWPRMKPATTNAAVSDRKLRRATPATSAPAISSRPKTATGSSRKSTPAAIGGTAETVAGNTGSDTVGRSGYRGQRLRRGLARYVPAIAAFAALPSAAAAAELPRAQTLSSGWEMRAQAAAPAPPQPPPPFEGQPEGTPAAQPAAARGGRAGQAAAQWSPVTVPNVFNAKAVASEYAGSVRRYRLRFTGPPTARGFRWLIHFESVRRGATVLLNGRRLGRNKDPYTPFTFEARGLRPNRPNHLLVIVDSRKDPRLPEGWWNWGGIVRPVSLIPAGPAHLHDLGTMSDVTCA